MTVNKAILGLVAEGWLVREKGRGTFLVEPLRSVPTRCLLLTKQAATAGFQDDYYYGTLYWKIREFFLGHDIQIDIASMDTHGIERLSESSDALYIALNPDQHSAHKLSELGKSGTPVVILGSSWEGGHVDTVDSDNSLGSAMAVNHLLDLGHKRIAFVCALIEDSNTVDRIKGFRFALKARRLEVRDEDIIVCSNTGQISSVDEERLVRGLSEKLPITAVVAAGPHLALSVLGLATRLGISVPDSLSVVAYDDPKFISMTHPPLTTVRQPLDEMAAKACQIALNRQKDPRIDFQQVILDPSLVIRSSTGLAPN